MPINASEFIKMLGIGKKKAAGTKGSVPQGPQPTFVSPTLPISPANNVNLGTAGDPRMAGGPPPMAASGGMSGDEWLSSTLR